MTIPGKTWKDQKRKRGKRAVKTNPSKADIRLQFQFQKKLRVYTVGTTRGDESH